MSKNELIEKAVIDCGGDWDLYEGIFCTREEFNAAADRMRGKPDWSTLPAKAEWLAQDRCGVWKPMQGRKPTIEEGSYWITDHHFQPQVRGTVLGDWRNTLEKRPEQKALPSIADRYGVEIPWDGRNALPSDVDCNCEVEVTFALGGAKYTETGNANRFNWMLVKSYKVIDERYKPKPAPAKPWFEAGELPKAGECCEYKFQNPDVSWQLVQVNYISEKHAILTVLDDGNECHADGFKAADFRPMRADKEKAIEAACAVLNNPKINTDIDASYVLRMALDALADAGCLKVPDQK